MNTLQKAGPVGGRQKKARQLRGVTSTRTGKLGRLRRAPIAGQVNWASAVFR